MPFVFINDGADRKRDDDGSIRIDNLCDVRVLYVPNESKIVKVVENWLANQLSQGNPFAFEYDNPRTLAKRIITLAIERDLFFWKFEVENDLSLIDAYSRITKHSVQDAQKLFEYNARTKLI